MDLIQGIAVSPGEMDVRNKTIGREGALIRENIHYD